MDNKSIQGFNLGRHLFGAAAMAAGLVMLAWPNGSATRSFVFVYGTAAVQILGGAAIQFRRSAKIGAGLLSAVYLVFVALAVPPIVTAPRVYNSWGNFFEQFSLLTGAAMIYARQSSAWSPETLPRIGRILVAVCVGSFTLEQAVYLDATAKLVPNWLPPGQTFWAIATTVLFALAAVALLANRVALLATRLLTIMILMFGILVWVPLLFRTPNNQGTWSECAETFAIAGVAWILADLLGERVAAI